MTAKRIQIVFELLLLTALAVLAGIFLHELGLLTRDLRADVNQIAAELHTTLVTVNVAADQARQASEQANLAAAEQRAYWNKTSLETYKTMASLRLTIVRTDQSINDVIAPQLADALKRTGDLSSTAAEELTKASQELAPSLANLARASSAAADAMADPAIRETLAHLDETSAHAAAAADQAAQTAAHVDAAAADIQAYIHRMTAPARGTWNFIKELLSLTYESRGAIGK